MLTQPDQMSSDDDSVKEGLDDVPPSIVNVPRYQVVSHDYSLFDNNTPMFQQVSRETSCSCDQSLFKSFHPVEERFCSDVVAKKVEPYTNINSKEYDPSRSNSHPSRQRRMSREKSIWEIHPESQSEKTNRIAESRKRKWKSQNDKEIKRLKKKGVVTSLAPYLIV